MRRFTMISTVVVSLLVSVNAWGVGPYTITDLGPGSATAINANGQVAGYTAGSGPAFLYTNGTMTPWAPWAATTVTARP